VPDSDGAVKSTGEVRAARRLYDGAPPVIPHDPFGADCSACHDAFGAAVEGVGFAPASPHTNTEKADATLRCRQCHVFVTTNDFFVDTEFVGLRQDLRRGSRLYDGAPPTIPHKILMRENCLACHAGPGARAEIVTTHPERTRCRQCHVPVFTRAGVLTYRRAESGNPEGS
jgi:cytochrome c-type protein NapB